MIRGAKRSGMTFLQSVNHHLITSRCFWILACLFSFSAARPQYFLGVQGGPLWRMGNKHQLIDLRAFQVGALLIQRDAEPVTYTAHLLWERDRFGCQGYQIIDRTDLYYDLNMRVDLLDIGCAARVALGASRSLFFEMGPAFGMQFAEVKDGRAYDRDYARTDTVMYAHAARSLFELRDVHLRTGFSGDIVLSSDVILHLALDGKIGSMGWTPGGSMLFIGAEASTALVFALPTKGKHR